MGKAKPPYPAEFRAEAVRLARSGQRPVARIARDLGVSAEALRPWVKQADLDGGKRTNGLTSAEREELGRLRRENRIPREERGVLQKAAAFFATGPKGHPAIR